MDSSKGLLKIFVLIDGKKVGKENKKEPNFYSIKLKEFEVKNEFQDLGFKILDNIEVNISLKIRNIIGGGFAARMNMFKRQETNQQTSGVISTGISMKDRLKLFNSKTLIWTNNKSNTTINITPKETNIQNKLPNNKEEPNIKKNIKKTNDEKKQKEVQKKSEDNKKVEQKTKTINKDGKEKQIKKEEKEIKTIEKEEKDIKKVEKEEKEIKKEDKVEKEEKDIKKEEKEIKKEDKVEKEIKKEENEEKEIKKEEKEEKEIKEEEKVENEEKEIIKEDKETKNSEKNNLQNDNKDNYLENTVNKFEEAPKIQIDKDNNNIIKENDEEKTEKISIEKNNKENDCIEEKEEKVEVIPEVKENIEDNENKKDNENNKEKIIFQENIIEEKKPNLAENKNMLGNDEIKEEKDNKYKDEWEYDDDSSNNDVEFIYKDTSNIEEENEETPDQNKDINEKNDKEELTKELEKEEKQETETPENKEMINKQENKQQQKQNFEKEESAQKLEKQENNKQKINKEKSETVAKEIEKIKENVPLQTKKRQSHQFTSMNFANKLAQNIENKKNPKKLDANKLEMIYGQRIIGQVAKEVSGLQKEERVEIKKSPVLNKEKNNMLMRNQTFIGTPSWKTKSKLDPKSRESISIVEDLGFEILDINDEQNQLSQSATNNTLTPQVLPEKTLSSVKFDEYLSKLELSGIKEIPHETFCEGFFLASFPEKGGQVIENSSKLFALCGHNECSELPSMKPEIIMRYPLKDTKNLELNNLAATICFPTGIKMCYSQDEAPKQIKDYVTQITNQKGERYYMRTFHFYKKMQNNSFINRYEIYPLKHHLNKFLDGFLFLKEEDFTEEITESIQQNLEYFQNFNNLDIVYIPCCLCLISKYPYALELEKCLNTIYNIMKMTPNSLNFEINDLIMYLIHSIPIPEKNMQVQFYIPYCNNPEIIIQCPKEDDISIMNNNHIILFNYLSSDNIILIFRLLLSEKKLLFIHDDYTELTNITNSFISLLYPFKWIHTYIPIMSDQMLKYLETFLPFLNGINISLITLVEQIFKESEIEDNEDVFLIYVKSNEIVLSSSFKKDKNKLIKYMQSNIPPLPFERELKKELKNIEYYKKRLKKDAIENKIRDAFINIFVKMFYDYEKYIATVDNDIVFNKVLFIQNRPDKEEKAEQFYDEFFDSQLFQQFLQYLPNSENSYFKRKIKEFKEKGNKTPKDKEKTNVINNNEIITYLATPYLGLDGQEVNNIEIILDNYKINKIDNKEENVKILENEFKIDNDKYINSKCLIYLNPENPENKEKSKEFENKNKKNKENIEKTNEKQIELIKENIKDTVINIFKSEIESGENKALKKKVFSNLETSEGREFFISLVSNNNNKIVYLEENSFIFLEELIRGILNSVLKLEETEQLFEEIVLLIKSTKFYETDLKLKSKQNNVMKIHTTMYRNMKNFLHSYNKITQNNLWQKWFNMELVDKIKESPNEIGNKKIIILDICNNLIDLEISKIIVKNITESINKIAFGEEKELFEQIKEEYTDLIAKAHYSSKSREA